MKKEKNPRVYANQWNGSEWKSAEVIDTGTGYPAWDPQIASDGFGKAIALFDQIDGTTDRIYANRWNGSAWAGAEIVDAGKEHRAWAPKIAFDGRNSAIAMFLQRANDRYANRWNGSEWEGAEIIDGGMGGNYANIASDGNGNTMVVFDRSDLLGAWDWVQRTYANRYVAKNYVELRVRPNGSGGYEFSPGDQVWLDWEVNPGPYELTSIPSDVYLAAVLNPVVEDGPAYIYQIQQSPVIYLFDSRFKPSRLKARSADATYPRVTFRRPDAHPSGSLSFTIPKNIAASRWAFAVVFVRLDGKGFPAMLPVEVSNSFTVH